LNELHVKLQLGVPMLQFFCRHPAAARCDSSCSPIRWMASAWIAPKETFSMPVSVFLESGIEA